MGDIFWNAVKLFRNEVQKQLPGKTIGLLWNNVVKVGKSSGRGKPPDYIHAIERNHFNIILEEVNITRPDLILFFSGPTTIRI